MKARRRRPPRAAPTPAAQTPPAPASLSLRHPTWVVAGLVAASCVALSVTYQIYEKDFWQHLAVGRAIWELHRVPTTQLWTWPTYGTPDVNSSWGFRALIWPVWDAGGVWGLFTWRWATTLAVFGLAFATARRLGARGFTPLLVIALCALTYRQRSQVRPETLASVWLALTIWLLEVRRSRVIQGGLPSSAWRDPALGLAPVLWAWTNTHLSYPLGLALMGAHAIDASFSGPRAGAGEKRLGSGGLWLGGGLGVLLAFLNPFGWRALAQPFEFFLSGSSEPIFSIIPELFPTDLRFNLKNGLPVILLGWPLLVAWRARQRRIDLVEILLGVGFLGLALASQRFLGFAMVVAAPYLARDLDEWVRSRRWPAWTRPAWSRAALAALACVGIGIPEWQRSAIPLGVSILWTEYPVAACDFMAREGIKGRGFNQFYLGGYMLHRFWPDRERLPFMDIHQAGTREDRDGYVAAMFDGGAWRALDARHRFDYALLKRTAYAGDRLLDFLDADTAFALVFLDDAAALWVRRDGHLAPIVPRLAYREILAGTARLGALGYAATTDSVRRRRIVAELRREISGSPHHAQALGRLGSLALATGDLATARRYLKETLRVNPRAARGHERLGLIALAEGRPQDALREFDAEHRLHGPFAREDFQRGRAWQLLGDSRRARRHYARELRRDAGNRAARDSLIRLEP
jgi:tetratricopeptide (TPR) repeat protein